MRKLFLYTMLVVGIPFFVVIFWKRDSVSVHEIKLQYLSNISVRVKREDSGIIQSIPLEEYVMGVVAGEMPVSFDIEALKAQCVASRSYVIRRIMHSRDSLYDVVDSVNNQVYLDESQLRNRWGDKYVQYINKIRQAVNETSMEYLEYNGEVIDAMFFSTSNGYTEDSGIVFSNSLPYLKSVESSYDKNVSPVFQKIETMSLQEFYDRLGLSYANNLNVVILEKSASNRVVKLKINGKDFRGRDVYYKLGIRSLDFSISQFGNNVSIETKGYGHGVGMSQYGALGMAKEGKSYKDILSHYYIGTNLKKWDNH